MYWLFLAADGFSSLEDALFPIGCVGGVLSLLYACKGLAVVGDCRSKLFLHSADELYTKLAFGLLYPVAPSIERSRVTFKQQLFNYYSFLLADTIRNLFFVKKFSWNISCCRDRSKAANRFLGVWSPVYRVLLSFTMWMFLFADKCTFWK